MRQELYKDDGGWIHRIGDLPKAIEQLFNGEDNSRTYRTTCYRSVDALRIAVSGCADAPIHIVPADLSREQWQRAKEGKYRCRRAQ